MTPPRIIGLSGKARHGKSTVADIVKQILSERGYGVQIIGFADGVREEAKERGWNGEKDEVGRKMLQDIGMARRAVDPAYWMEKLMAKLMTVENTVVIVPDVRFRNEATVISRLEGELWRVRRPRFSNDLTPEQRWHPSEVELDDWLLWDVEIINDGAVGLLLGAVVEAVKYRRWFP